MNENGDDTLFAWYYLGMQQDMKLLILPPLVCALFRAIFIYVYAPSDRWKKPHWVAKLLSCFRYGFWWGMDWHAYVYLVSLVLVTLPGTFWPAYYAIGDRIRLAGILLYMATLYFAFAGKMIFYYHFRDTYNRTLFLGKNADKKNLADIFFNQHHGWWILLGTLPYLYIGNKAADTLLRVPTFPWPSFSSAFCETAFVIATFMFSVLFFYFFRFGGTLDHGKKPEWDEVPALVKDDDVLAKAVVDDFVALEMAFHAATPPCLMHTDEESLAVLANILPEPFTGGDETPFSFFRHRAAGARIPKPKHIFFLFAEGHAQALLDPIYSGFHLMDASKSFRRWPGTITIDNFLAGGMISQPSIASMLTGIYDVNLELNENTNFWHGTVPTSLAKQIKRLGYSTEFWYGGKLTWASLEHFVPASGFDQMHGGPDFCPSESPRTWLGVHDHIFLEETARIIRKEASPSPSFHFIYTTSNHGPYKLPLVEYGYNAERLMPDYAATVCKYDPVWRRLGGAWYADQALVHFLEEMRETFPDSLFIVTGDHSIYLMPFECGIMPNPEPTIREHACTSFAISHPALKKEMFAGNTIGGHLHILPTIMELIAPKDFLYYSLFPSLLEPIDHVVTPYYWMTRNEVGMYENRQVQELALADAVKPARRIEKAGYEEEMAGWCELTGWVVRHPHLLSS